MIKFENRYDSYAYRMASGDVDSSVTALEEGQWVTYNSSGKLVISDGTKRSFICTASKRDGRDLISGTPVKKAAFLHGVFCLSVSNFDATKTYTEMCPLKVTTDGILTLWVSGTDSAELIVANAVGAPTDGFLRILSK